MNEIRITSNDIALVKQQHQRRYFKIQLVDREWRSRCVIKGRLISATSNIDASSGIRRSANITIETEQRIIHIPSEDINVDLQKDISMNYYVRLWAGIEDNDTLKVTWYNQGLFVINQSQYNFDPETRTLSLGLTDLMCDLTGDRAGVLHAYTSLVKNEQRIDTVMKDVLELADFNVYSITPIVPLQSTDDSGVYAPSEEDYLIPYDKKFEASVAAYDILDWLVSLYPYYELGFDVDGVFFCRKKLLDEDDSSVLIDGYTLAGLVISEDTTLDWFSIKNVIEVWGKDGLYYGEAKDENPESPFQVAGGKPFRYVISGSEDGIDTNNICDRYKDTELASTLLKEQAELENTIATLEALGELTPEQQTRLAEAKNDLSVNKRKQDENVALKGDELASEWAQEKLYEKSRLYDSISITTIGMPFINDVGFKMSYRSKVDDTVSPYKVESVSHDYIAGTSTFTMVRFYDDMCSNLWDELDKPVISDYDVSYMTLTVSITPVVNAESYSLYIDGRKVAESTGTTITYTLYDEQAGTHDFYVVANAPYYRGHKSDTETATFSTSTSIVTSDGFHIIANTGDRIIVSEADILTTSSGDTITTNTGDRITIRGDING